MLPSNQCSFHLDQRALQHNPTSAIEPAKSVTFPFMIEITHTDLIQQKQIHSRQHLKVLCREENVWIDAMGTLDTGTEDNWIGAHVLSRSGAQPRSRIKEENYTDFQGQRFSATETVKICWYAANSTYMNEGEFRVMNGAGFEIILGRQFLESRGIYKFNEKALLSYQGKASKGLTYLLLRSIIMLTPIILEDEMRMQGTSSVQQDANSRQIYRSLGPYEAFGRSSSSTSGSAGFGSTDKPRPTSLTELKPWICSYCAQRHGPAQSKCSRCGNDRIGLKNY